MCVSVCVYMYMYMYIYLRIYVYIERVRERERERKREDVSAFFVCAGSATLLGRAARTPSLGGPMNNLIYMYVYIYV